MEAAQLGPRGGERARDPGNPALERAGDESTAGSGDNGQAAPPGGIESAGATRGSHEGPSRDPDNGKHEGAGRPRSTERPQNSGEWTTEDPGDGASEGSWKPRLSPGSPRDDERPSAGSITRTGSPRTHERAGITGTRSSGFPVTPGPGVSEGSGVPRRSSHEGAIDSRANSESQWTAGPTSTEGANLTQPHGERGSHEASIASGTSQSEESTSSRASTGQGPLAPGTNSSQELNAPGSREKWLNTGSTVGEGTPVTNNGDGSLELRTTPSRASTMERAGDAWATDSFKKPISPAGPAGNEKTMEPRSKPAQPSPNTSSSLSSRASSTEASPDACHGLPSDAYRATPAIPYREPSWSGLPGSLYSLEILRGGSIASTKSLEGVSWTLFGRLPGCHVSLEHPSVSRYHAVLQYRQLAGSEPDQEPGFYIYDLGSTHGTFLNKQRIQSKTYCRFRVGHVLKFGGSTRLFILQGPEEDQEAESELSVTQIKEARRQKETLQKKMLGEDSDEEDLPEEGESSNVQSGSGEDGGGCMWGMGEDALEEENDENPIALEFQEDREALYLKNPKKALQGFYDREGEELEYEYEQQGCNTWLCRVKLPVDDSLGKQLVAEALHSGKKKEAAIQCALEACRILDSRGLLRQEAVSRKRKAKQWEDDDYYDSDDDTFLDRTGLVEKKRLNRMKKAGKIEEKPETFDSLVAKLNLVDVELAEIATKLQTSQTGEMHSSAQDSLDAFMTEIKSESSLDSVSRKKLHLRSFELKKEQQRLKGLIKIVQPTKLPELCSTVDDSKKKKLQLPMFGAMKGGRKFKLKTGTVGKLPPKRTDLPAGFFSMKASNNEPEEEEEEEDEPEQEECMQVETTRDPSKEPAVSEKARKATPAVDTTPDPTEAAVTENRSSCVGPNKNPKDPSPSGDGEEFPKSKSTVTATDENKEITSPKQKRVHGPSRPPQNVPPSRYPEDDPDYCVWTPPAGQTGDGKTHLNKKYGY